MTSIRASVMIHVFLFSIFGIQTMAFCAEYDLASAEGLFLEGRYEKVIDVANRLIEARSRNRDEIYYIKALSELKTGHFKDARQSFNYIISRYQRSARTFDAYVGIGDAYFLEGDIKQALKIYDEISEQFPNDKNIAVVYQRLGDCYNRLDMGEKAKGFFEKAKGISPLLSQSQMQKEPMQPAFKVTEIPQSERGQFISVQIGSFRNKKNAEQLNKKVSQAGFDSYIETPAGLGERLYRVKVGRLKSAEEAKMLEARLKKNGYKTRICGDTACI